MTDNYPDDDELEKIINWKPDDKAFKDLMEYVYELWHLKKWGFKQEGNTYYISTGGWSGNESIIDALTENNFMFWVVCWQSSKRGGHYVFEIPDYKVWNKID